MSTLRVNNITDTSGTAYGYSRMVLTTAQNTTSGTAIDFTGIPSWVKKITVMLNGVSTNGTSSYLIQLGTGVTPTYVTSGYLGSALRAAANTTSETVNSSGFRIVDSIAAASINHGSVLIANLTGNTWTEQGVVCLSNVASANMSGGSIALSGALTAVRLTTVNGTDTFDAGSVNILYEGY